MSESSGVHSYDVTGYEHDIVEDPLTKAVVAAEMKLRENYRDITTSKFWLAVVAEFIGTGLLVLVACGSCRMNAATIDIAMSFGLTVGAVVWAIAHVSGGHINPAVTVAFLVTRKITMVRAVLYVVAQCGGAVAGALALKVTTMSMIAELGTSSPSEGIGSARVVLVELAITFLLVFVVFATCDSNRKGFNGSGPLSIGLSVTAGHLYAIHVTGAGTNPARVFGPALVSNYWNVHWAYWLGPIIGGIAAGLLYDLTFAVNASRAKLRAFFTRGNYDDEQFDENGNEVVRRLNDDMAGFEALDPK